MGGLAACRALREGEGVGEGVAEVHYATFLLYAGVSLLVGKDCHHIYTIEESIYLLPNDIH